MSFLPNLSNRFLPRFEIARIGVFCAVLRIILRLVSEEGATGCSLNIVFFPENFVIFLNSVSSGAALVFYLPGVCTHTDFNRENREKQETGIFCNLWKKHNI